MGRIDAESETLIPTIGGGFDDPISFGWQNSSQQGLSASASHTPTLDKSKVPAIAIHETGKGYWQEGDISGTLRAEGENRPSRPSNVIFEPTMQVRRLTPVECERLQGFPDSYTDIKPRGKPTPDGPRYKALGNSMAVPVMRWIGERIKAVDAIARITA